MRILVLSDSHGRVENMERCVALAEPDHILHLGDCVRDAQCLHRLFPAIPMTTVPGNCDWGDGDEPEKLIELGGCRILMMHGHTRGVKYGLQRAVYAAREAGAQVLTFGHTHQALSDYDGSLYVLNPGTAGGVHAPAGYGVITVNAGRVSCSVFRI
ncbi:MAG: YfcE family phosphodiesterase [Oscillospiraceae bacterium]|nr:YfcE family phosphodiesterase [Oscillospiraceae bacterium]